MKNIIAVLSFLFVFLSCSRIGTTIDENAVVSMPKEFVGKWKFVEICANSGGIDCNWKPYDSGHMYDLEFKADGIYLSPNAANACTKGSFRFADNTFKKLYLKNPCETAEGFWYVKSYLESEIIVNDPYFEGTNYRWKKIPTSN